MGSRYIHAAFIYEFIEIVILLPKNWPGKVVVANSLESCWQAKENSQAIELEKRKDIRHA